MISNILILLGIIIVVVGFLLLVLTIQVYVKGRFVEAFTLVFISGLIITSGLITQSYAHNLKRTTTFDGVYVVQDITHLEANDNEVRGMYSFEVGAPKSEETFTLVFHHNLMHKGLSFVERDAIRFNDMKLMKDKTSETYRVDSKELLERMEVLIEQGVE